jgi:hypothetical protein
LCPAAYRPSHRPSASSRHDRTDALRPKLAAAAALTIPIGFSAETTFPGFMLRGALGSYGVIVAMIISAVAFTHPYVIDVQAAREYESCR